MMDFRIETFPETLLVGVRQRMSMAQNQTSRLWQRFMPRRKEIKQAQSDDLYSVQRYSADYFQSFQPELEFEKWAAVPVELVDRLPEGMEPLTIPEGLYVCFHYRGASADGAKVFQWIFGEWLPQSGYEPDDRPHFEILGAKYKNNDPDSEEEIWVPLKKKATD